MNKRDCNLTLMCKKNIFRFNKNVVNLEFRNEMCLTIDKQLYGSFK